MKVYLQYDGEPDGSVNLVSGDRVGRESTKLKLTLPAAWLSGPCSKVLEFFVSSYNKKCVDDKLSHALVAEHMFLHCCGVDMPLDGILSNFVNDYNDVHIKHKVVKVDNAAVKRPEGSVLCTNYGCGKYFVPGAEDNQECVYHAKPPVFHDTYKYWACCPKIKAADWEEFEKIATCQKGAHSTENRPLLASANPVEDNAALTNTALSAEEVSALKASAAPQTMCAPSDDGGKHSGPREFEGAVSQQQDAPGPIDADGYATCRNYGCQKRFKVGDNSEAECVFHTGAPVFWDTYKYWKCCPNQKRYEFDDFVKVPGCASGSHKL